jgi:hypothetical protein
MSGTVIVNCNQKQIQYMSFIHPSIHAETLYMFTDPPRHDGGN